MKEAITYFEGEHDFTSFTTGDNIQESYVRTIYKTDISFEDDIITITFVGNGFLRYMVRNMVGVLIKVGENQIEPQEIKTILNKKDRTQASITASAVGLYLKDVRY